MRDLNRWTCLHHAAWVGHVAAISTLLGETSPSHGTPGGKLSAPLQLGAACATHADSCTTKVEIVQQVEPSAGADSARPGERVGKNAVGAGKTSTADSKRLARETRNRNKVADVNAKDRWSRTPLAWAVGSCTAI